MYCVLVVCGETQSLEQVSWNICLKVLKFSLKIAKKKIVKIRFRLFLDEKKFFCPLNRGRGGGLKALMECPPNSRINKTKHKLPYLVSILYLFSVSHGVLELDWSPPSPSNSVCYAQDIGARHKKKLALLAEIRPPLQRNVFFSLKKRDVLNE